VAALGGGKVPHGFNPGFHDQIVSGRPLVQIRIA